MSSLPWQGRFQASRTNTCIIRTSIRTNTGISRGNIRTNTSGNSQARRGCCGCLVVFLILGIIGSQIDDKKPSEAVSDTSSSTQTEQSTSRKVVENSAWDGSVRPVKKYLEQNLNDARSVQYVAWSPVVDLRDAGGKGTPYAYMVRCKYRAKNAFGAYVLAEQIFYMDEQGKVAKVNDLN